MRVNLSHQTHSIDKIYECGKSLKKEVTELSQILENQSFNKHESFVLLPFDENHIIKLLEFKKKFPAKNLKRIIVLGIGGSIQGAKAIYELLKNEKTLIHTEWIDQIDSEKINKNISELKNLNPDEYLVFIITKSGSTTETLFNFELFESNFKLDSNRLVFITEETSHLVSICESKNYNYLTFPKKISGRFSVFTMVGLAPLAIAGVNIIKLLEGGMLAVNSINNFEENYSLQSAVAKFLAKRIINENLYPTRHFGELGKWEKQLFNESLGKTSNAMFSSFGNFYLELHSSLQLYLNSKNVFLNIVSYKNLEPLSVKETDLLSKNFYHTESEEINKAILTSVVRELDKNLIPTITIELKSLDEVEIGNYMQNKMQECYFLCKLNDVNPFDQPDVNSYKENLIRYI